MIAAQGEYRRHERTGLKLPVEINIADSNIPSSTVNISSSGIALSIPPDTPLQKGQIINVLFSSPDKLNVRARVVHAGEQQAGLSLYQNQFTDTDIETLIESAPLWQRLHVHIRHNVWKQSRRIGILTANTVFRPFLMGALQPRFLFVAYGTRKDADTYFTPWMERLLPPVIICGVIRNGNKRGFLVASKYLESELSQDSNKVLDYLQKLLHGFPDVERMALVGRLPNFVLKAGVTLESPFVDGSMGTRYMIWDAARQMAQLPEYTEETGITVLGGAGRIGNLVCKDLLRLFPTVIAYDKRYTKEEIIHTDNGTIIKSALPRRLAEHKLFIGLTHHGDVIREFADDLPKGSLIADDTHPCISLAVREYLAERQIRTLKIVLSHNQFGMTPRMPAWNNRDIPGCLVEALVLLENNEDTAKNFNLFQQAAVEAGFFGCITQPLDE